MILDELEDLKRDRDKADFSERVRGMRSRVNSALNKLHDEANPVEQLTSNNGQLTVNNKALKQYDTVLLVDIDKKGTIISPPDAKGGCVVQIGIMKTKTNVRNLRLVEEKNEATLNGKSIGNVTVSKITGSKNVRSNLMELDIRGMNSDEGINAVDEFIDSSIMSNIGSVTIIHGKGTGILRKAVHDYLKRNKRVESFRLGKYGEGEDGVTIVTIK